MPTTPVGGIGQTPATLPAAGTTPASTSATGANGLGQDAFLKLLVAQLRYQDPLNPTDGTQFMAQTAQFTMVEKLGQLSKQTADLLDSQRLLGSAALIGRTVTYPAPDGTEATGVVTAARLTADGLVLRVGDAEVPLSSVREVSSVPRTSTSTGTDAGPTATG